MEQVFQGYPIFNALFTQPFPSSPFVHDGGQLLAELAARFDVAPQLVEAIVALRRREDMVDGSWEDKLYHR